MRWQLQIFKPVTRVLRLESPHREKQQNSISNQRDVKEWNWKEKLIFTKGPKILKLKWQ